MFFLRDMLRYIHGGDRKPKSVFSSEKEAYDFCRNLYKKNGGVTPELRRAYDLYKKNSNGDSSTRFEANQHNGTDR